MQRGDQLFVMSSGFSEPPRSRSTVQSWLLRNQASLLTVDIICITLLFFSFLITSTFQVLANEQLTVIQIVTLVSLAFIILSIVRKGIVPLIVCILGVVLIHNSIILPYYAAPETGEAYFGDRRVVWTLYAPEAVKVAAGMHFFLGVSMVAFSLILAYRPSLLFARNRPAPADTEWSNYPVWHDNAVLADGHSDPAVPLRSLVTDLDRYLLWRYEYVLVSIYGTPHLVRPEGLVPKHSTTVFRDKSTGRIVGKARYSGFFM